MKAMSIKDKRVIVTGGSRGLGEGIVKTLVSEGARVVSMDRSIEAGKHVVEQANKLGGGEALFVQCDVGVRSQVFEAFAAAAEWLGGLDALVHNAGIHGKVCPSEELTEEELDQVITVNAKGTVFTNQAAYPHLEKQGGSIVNFSSKQGVSGEAFGGAYGMTKAGVLGWSRSIALEWGRKNIRVNTVCPFIASPLVGETRKQYGELAQRRTLDLGASFIPLGDGSFGDAEEDLAPAVAFLVSDASRFITGQMFSIGGGEFFTR